MEQETEKRQEELKRLKQNPLVQKLNICSSLIVNCKHVPKGSPIVIDSKFRQKDHIKTCTIKEKKEKEFRKE